MNFLIADPFYPEREELCEDFATDLHRRVQEEFGDDARVEDVDAGPSASIPAYFLDLLSPAADALALLGAPLALQGLAGWKAWFERGVTFLDRLGLAYAIDIRTAALLAANTLLESAAPSEEIEVISATRHWMNLGGPGSDHLTQDALASPDEPLSRHFAAVTQLDAHYVLFLRLETRTFTVLVAHNGAIIHIEELGLR